MVLCGAFGAGLTLHGLPCPPSSAPHHPLQVPPPDFVNLGSRYRNVDVYLSYHPIYGTIFQAPPDRPPEPGSFEHPCDPQQWLFSVEAVNTVRAVGWVGKWGCV